MASYINEKKLYDFNSFYEEFDPKDVAFFKQMRKKIDLNRIKDTIHNPDELKRTSQRNIVEIIKRVVEQVRHNIKDFVLNLTDEEARSYTHSAANRSVYDNDGYNIVDSAIKRGELKENTLLTENVLNIGANNTREFSQRAIGERIEIEQDIKKRQEDVQEIQRKREIRKQQLMSGFVCQKNNKNTYSQKYDQENTKRFVQEMQFVN